MQPLIIGSATGPYFCSIRLTMSQWVLHMASRGLLGNGADVYWWWIGVSVLANVSQLGLKCTE
jgi:hypothetical protein